MDEVGSIAIGEVNRSAILAAAGDHRVDIWEPLGDPGSVGEDADAQNTSRGRGESSYANAVYASRTWLSTGVVGDGESSSSHPRDLFDAAGMVTSLALDEHSGVTAVGTAGGLVEIRGTATGRRVSLLDTNAGAVTAVAFAALHGQRMAIVATAQKTISAWDVHTGRRLHTFTGHVDGLWDISAADIAATPHMVSVGMDRKLILWNAATGRRALLEDDTGWWPRSVAFGAVQGHAVIAEGTVHGPIRLWDPLSHSRLGIMTGHIDPVTALAFGQAGDLPLLASVAGSVKLWNPADGSLLWTLPVKGVTGAVFAEFGGRTVLATAGSDGVGFWDPVQREPLLVFDPEPGRYIDACSKQGSTTLAVADYRNLVVFRSAG